MRDLPTFGFIFLGLNLKCSVLSNLVVSVK